MYNFPLLKSDQIHHYNSINVFVEGYWSNPITIYIQRKSWNPDGPAYWSFEVSNSSGGKESDYDSLKASENFANTILECVKYCNTLKEDIDWLERNYQQNHLAKIREYEAEDARKKALVDADPQVGVQEAKKLVSELLNTNTIITMVIGERGDGNRVSSITKRYTPGGTVKGRIGGENYSRADLITLIAESSAAKLKIYRDKDPE
jgi:hypothetical protein